jgi:hypothetical protein
MPAASTHSLEKFTAMTALQRPASPVPVNLLVRQDGRPFYERFHPNPAPAGGNSRPRVRPEQTLGQHRITRAARRDFMTYPAECHQTGWC